MTRREESAKRAQDMYDLYTAGKSLSQVGLEFGVTRQRVFDIFKRRRLTLRSRKLKPTTDFNGCTYTINVDGYFRKTDDDRSLLHRDMWATMVGPIPDGWDIHHKDEDKIHNELSNLECLPKEDHTRLYSPHNNQFTIGAPNRSQKERFPEKQCLYCKAILVPHSLPVKETPSAFAKRQYCNLSCSKYAMWTRRECA